MARDDRFHDSTADGVQAAISSDFAAALFDLEEDEQFFLPSAMIRERALRNIFMMNSSDISKQHSITCRSNDNFMH